MYVMYTQIRYMISTRKSSRLLCKQGGRQNLPKASSLASLSFSALYLIQHLIKHPCPLILLNLGGRAHKTLPWALLPAVLCTQWMPLQGRVDSTVSHQQPLMGGDEVNLGWVGGAKVLVLVLQLRKHQWKQVVYIVDAAT